LPGWKGLETRNRHTACAGRGAVALDLPEIGDSRGAPASSEKTVLADIALTAAEGAGARDIVVAGLDVGGMIAFAAARDHGARLSGAIVMNTVIPGLEPWSEIISDPRIWHFAFHALPDLPETLVRGHERLYFDFFTDFLSGDPKRISDELRTQFVRLKPSRPASIGIAPCPETPRTTPWLAASRRPCSMCAATPTSGRSIRTSKD
jgi:pimeloyl-ACP methyl ester carboxylesterase